MKGFVELQSISVKLISKKRFESEANRLFLGSWISKELWGQTIKSVNRVMLECFMYIDLFVFRPSHPHPSPSWSPSVVES